jgi:hypothetical protein
MAKTRLRLVGSQEQKQMTIFEMLSQQAEEREAAPAQGAMNIQVRLRGAIALALKKVLPKSRWVVADEMSHLLGVEVSKYQLDSWVAESKEGHRMPAEYIPALCEVTDCLEPLQLLNDTCKVFTVKGPDALRAEIRKDEELIKTKQRDKRKKEALLDALVGAKE